MSSGRQSRPTLDAIEVRDPVTGPPSLTRLLRNRESAKLQRSTLPMVSLSGN
jgi:hypothetical protein